MGIQSLIVLHQDHVHFSPWLVPSKLPVNLPEERPLVSNWPPRLPVRAPPPPVESRSPIVIVPVPWLFVRSAKTSRLTCVSNPLPSWPSKRLLRLTSSVSSKTPTCALSMPSVSPSCPRTSNLPAVSVENALKQPICFSFQPKTTAFFKATISLRKETFVNVFSNI